MFIVRDILVKFVCVSQTSEERRRHRRRRSNPFRGCCCPGQRMSCEGL